MIVDWSCDRCDAVFDHPPMTRAEYEKTPWRWCPKCGSSAQPVSVRTVEGTFHRSRRRVKA